MVSTDAHLIELAKGADGRTWDEATARMTPSYTREISAFVHGKWVVVDAHTLDREGLRKAHPYEVGIHHDGWYEIEYGSPVRMEQMQLVAYEWTARTPLPQYLTLSDYDLGLKVVVTAGSAMGQVDVIDSYGNGSWSPPAVTLLNGVTHLTSFLGAVASDITDPDEIHTLAPMEARLPPGSPVWARSWSHTWNPAVVTGYRLGNYVEIFDMEDGEVTYRQRDRRLVVAREDSIPPDSYWPGTHSRGRVSRAPRRG